MSIGRRVASATIFLSVSNVIVRLLSFVTMPILTHLLLPSAYGVVAIAGSLVSLTSVVALAGMDMSYARAFHTHALDERCGVEVFAWRYILVAGAIGGLLLVLCWVAISSSFSLPRYLAALLGAGVFFSVVSTMAQVRVRLSGRYSLLAMSTVVSGLGCAAISIGTALWWRQDELALVLSLVAAHVIPTFFLGTPSIARLIRPSGLGRSGGMDILKVGLAGTVTAPAYWILSSSDRWFLVYFEDTTSVGIYSIGFTVGIIGMMANSAVMSVWTPEAAREYGNDPSRARHSLGALAERLVAGYACVWLVVTAIGADVIKILAPPAFHEAAVVVPFVAAGVFFYGISHLAYSSLLLVKRLDYAMWCWIAGGVVCLFLNLLLVPEFGRIGAALTQAIAFALIAGGIVYGAQKHYPLTLAWRRLAALMVGSLSAGGLMSISWASSPLTDLLLKFPVGLLSAFVIAKTMAPEVLFWIAQRLHLNTSQR